MKQARACRSPYDCCLMQGNHLGHLKCLGFASSKSVVQTLWPLQLRAHKQRIHSNETRNLKLVSLDLTQPKTEVQASVWAEICQHKVLDYGKPWQTLGRQTPVLLSLQDVLACVETSLASRFSGLLFGLRCRVLGWNQWGPERICRHRAIIACRSV